MHNFCGIPYGMPLWAKIHFHVLVLRSQITKFMDPTWDPPGCCRPQMGPMLVPWNLLSGLLCRVQHRVTSDRIITISHILCTPVPFYTFRPRQNGQHRADGIFKSIFAKWKLSYFDSNFAEICSQGPINNQAALRHCILTNEGPLYWHTDSYMCHSTSMG